ncbi:MAG: hypothetical protein V4549_06720 [Bacteroidota bacterium]
MAKITLEIAADTSSLPGATSDVTDFTKAATNAGEAQKKAFKSGSDAANAAQKDIANFANSISIAGVSVGDVSSKFSGLKKGLDVATKGFGVLRTAIAATGIGAILLAFTSLVALFKKTERGAEALERIMSGLGAAFDVIIGLGAKIGETLIKAFTSPLSALKSLGDAIKHPIDTFNKLSDTVAATTRNMIAHAAAAAEITRAFQDLEDQERENSLVISKNQTEIDKLLVQSKNRTLSEKERLEFLDKAASLEKSNLETELKGANDRIALINRENKLKDLNGTLRDEDRQKEIDAILRRDALERDSLVLQERIITRRDALEQEVFAKLMESQKELNKQLESLSGIPIFDNFIKSGKEAVDAALKINTTIKKVGTTAVPVGLSIGESFQFAAQQVADMSKKYSAFIDDLQTGIDLVNQLEQIGTENRIKNIDAETQLKLDSIDLEIEKRQAAGLAFEDLENKKKAIQLDSDNQVKKLQKEQFERNKKYQKANAIINGAQSVLKTYAEFGFTPAGIAAAILDAALVALQIAVIDKQEFWKGGYTGDGGKYDEAGTVHKGEFVTTKEKTRQHRNILDAIHTGDYSALTNADLSPLLRGTGVVLKEDVPVRINQAHSDIRRSQTSNTEVILGAMDKKMEDFFKFYKGKPEETESKDGTRIIKTGNTVRRIRKK